MARDSMLILISLLSYIFPKYAYQLLKRFQFTPNTQESDWPEGIRRLTYKTKYGDMRTYRLGEGKCIWLLHGWADSYQFMPLIQKLVEQGYCCIAIEFLPVDETKQSLVSLPQWSNVFEVAVKHLEEPQHVITHGLATSVIGNSKWFSRFQGNLSLVSPVLDFSASLKSFIKAHGMAVSLLGYMQQEVLETDQVELKSLSTTKNFEAFTGNLSVFYSRSDETSTIRAIKSLTTKENRRISEFKGASTSKIIESRSLLFTVKQDVVKLDVAI